MKAIIHYADGTSVVVGTDGTWLQSQATSWSQPASPVARSGSGDGYIERIDARNLTPTWFMPGFDDSAWTAATVIGGQTNSTWTGHALARPDAHRRDGDHAGVGHQPSGGNYMVDLGKVYSGMPSIQFSGGASGTTIGMLGGFALLPSGDIDPSQNQSTTMTYYAVLNGSNFTYQPAEYHDNALF